MARAFTTGVLGLVLVILPVATTPAQGRSDVLSVRAARRDTVVAAATVTAAFTVANRSGDIVHVSPRVEMPPDWTLLMGGTPFAVAPEAADMLMLSVVVPGRAPAGTYILRVTVASGVSDSLVVRVPARRALEISLLDRPGFVVSGQSYRVSVMVRNRGNAATRVALSASSTLGKATIADTEISLAADESRVVRAQVTTPAGFSAGIDDVLQIAARHVGESAPPMDAGPAEASARVMVVPEPSRTIEEYLKVPTQVNLRAASSDGVSPFEIYGRGPLRDGSSTRMDFMLRGPTGDYSPFGERDEYRFQLVAPAWRVRAGDNVYMLSPLTGSAQPGFGGGVDGSRGTVSAGAYGQHFRRSLEKGNEMAAFVALQARPELTLGLNAVNRQDGVLPGRVGSATAAFTRGLLNASAELAGSRSASGPGRAQSLRLSQGADLYSFDLGYQAADTAFSGAQRGAAHTYLGANLHQLEHVSLALNAGRHRSDLTRTTGVPYVDRMDVATLGATLFDRYTVELGALSRVTTVSGASQGAEQRSLRVRGDHALTLGLVTVESEVGTAHDALVPTRTFSTMSLGLRHAVGAGSLAGWVEHYSGGAVARGMDGSFTLGGDGTVQLNRLTDLSFIAYGTRLRRLGAEWHSQLDARISRLLRNGSRLTLRARVNGSRSVATRDRAIAYLEYGMPLRLPVSRLRTPGRVYGRVVDAVSGEGVAGALVRLGPQVGITDRNGKVSFGGVPGGEHRLSMSQETSFADAVFVGDPTLVVDSTRPRPTTFQLAIARSARLDITVRRFVALRTAVAGAPDSLVDAGPLANATLVLAGERDTLYRTTRDDGTVAFTDIPPGKWVLSIRGDAPAYHRFDPDRQDLLLEPGEVRQLGFRLLPRRREVQLIGDGQELRSEAADPKSQPAGTPTTRIRKPDEQRPDSRRPNQERNQDH